MNLQQSNRPISYFLENPDLTLKRGSKQAVAYDVYSAASREIHLAPGIRWKFHTGLYLAMHPGIIGRFQSRSGLGTNHGVCVTNGGVIDPDYRGECCVTLTNLDRNQSHTILPGDRIAQITFEPVFPDCVELFMRVGPLIGYRNDFWEPYRVSDRKLLEDTDRGEGGHGSTGR